MLHGKPGHWTVDAPGAVWVRTLRSVTIRLIKSHRNSRVAGLAALSVAPTKINVNIPSEFRQVAEQEIPAQVRRRIWRHRNANCADPTQMCSWSALLELERALISCGGSTSSPNDCVAGWRLEGAEQRLADWSRGP